MGEQFIALTRYTIRTGPDSWHYDVVGRVFHRAVQIDVILDWARQVYESRPGWPDKYKPSIGDIELVEMFEDPR